MINLELPRVRYRISIGELFIVIKKSGGRRAVLGINDLLPNTTNLILSPEEIVSMAKISLNSSSVKARTTLAMVLTLLRPHEDQSIVVPDAEGSWVGTKPGIAWALFYVYPPKTYEYLRVRIGPSGLNDAGNGVYAFDPIPRGAISQYIGLIKDRATVDMMYSWSVEPYNPSTGETLSSAASKDMWYVDGSVPEKANWTRYVNCGQKKISNNMDVEQVFDKMYYITLERIESGAELFIDYGVDYRTKNLKILKY